MRVQCVCTYEHELKTSRNKPDKAIICHFCGRSLFWKHGVPIARRPIPHAGQYGTTQFDERELHICST